MRIARARFLSDTIHTIRLWRQSLCVVQRRLLAGQGFLRWSVKLKRIGAFLHKSMLRPMRVTYPTRQLPIVVYYTKVPSSLTVLSYVHCYNKKKSIILSTTDCRLRLQTPNSNCSWPINATCLPSSRHCHKWPRATLWFTDQLWPISAHVQTHLLRQAGGLSQYRCGRNKARPSCGFRKQWKQWPWGFAVRNLSPNTSYLLTPLV